MKDYSDAVNFFESLKKKYKGKNNLIVNHLIRLWVNSPQGDNNVQEEYDKVCKAFTILIAEKKEWDPYNVAPLGFRDMLLHFENYIGQAGPHKARGRVCYTRTFQKSKLVPLWELIPCCNRL